MRRLAIVVTTIFLAAPGLYAEEKQVQGATELTVTRIEAAK